MTRKLTKILSTSLLFALATITTATAAPAEMRVFEGFASANALLKGDLSSAVTIADKRKDSTLLFSRFVNQTTLCVALTKLGKLDRALESCNRAEFESQGISEMHLDLYGYYGLDKAEVRQIAKENLAVTQSLLRTVTQQVAGNTQ